jgi:WD40 repeat protein
MDLHGTSEPSARLHTRAVWSVQVEQGLVLTSDSSQLFLRSEDTRHSLRTLGQWRYENGHRRYSDHFEGVSTITRDGQYILSGGGKHSLHSLRLWSIETGQCLREMPGGRAARKVIHSPLRK